MRKGRSIPIVSSRIISSVLHPLLVPLYLSVYLAADSPLLGLLSVSSRASIVGLVAVNAVLLPAFYIWMMFRFGIIRDRSLSRPADRIRPLLVVALCYGLAIWGFRDMVTATMISAVMWAGLLGAVTAAVVTPFWKISLHMMAQGGASALLTLLCISGTCPVWLCCTAIAAAGAVGSAGLCLGDHDSLQTAAGWTAGAALMCCSLFTV